MTEQTIRFKIFRYKQGQAMPHFDTFDVTVDENETVLTALQAIRTHQDPTLALRHSCHHASCGTCGMRVNGKEVLACVTKVLELGTPTVTVEPMQNLALVSDLVVDMTPFFNVYAIPDRPYIRQSEFLPAAQAPEGIDLFTRYESCLECGLCVSACPIAGSDGGYLGPAAMTAAWRLVEEPRGRDPAPVLDWVDQEHGCWRCHVAFECSEICPSGADPAAAVMNLRRALTRRKFARLLGR